MSDTLQPYGTWPARFLYPWDSPGKNSGVGCSILLQEIFLTWGLNPHLLLPLLWKEGSLPLVPPGKLFGAITCSHNCPLPNFPERDEIPIESWRNCSEEHIRSDSEEYRVAVMDTVMCYPDLPLGMDWPPP